MEECLKGKEKMLSSLEAILKEEEDRLEQRTAELMPFQPGPTLMPISSSPTQVSGVPLVISPFRRRSSISVVRGTAIPDNLPWLSRSGSPESEKTDSFTLPVYSYKAKVNESVQSNRRTQREIASWISRSLPTGIWLVILIILYELSLMITQ